MNKLLLLLCVTYFLASCQNRDDCSPASTSLKLLPDKQITIEQVENYDSQIFTVVPGDGLLAQYVFTKAQCENTYDDEYSESLTFAVNTGSEEFMYRDEDIQQTQCFYKQIGAWVGGYAYAINKGIIKGKKLSGNQWYIEIDVEITPLKPGIQAKAIKAKGFFSN